MPVGRVDAGKMGQVRKPEAHVAFVGALPLGAIHRAGHIGFDFGVEIPSVGAGGNGGFVHPIVIALAVGRKMDVPDVGQARVGHVEPGVFLPVVGLGGILVPAAVEVPEYRFRSVAVAFEGQRHLPFVIEAHHHQQLFVRGGGGRIAVEPEACFAAIVRFPHAAVGERPHPHLVDLVAVAHFVEAIVLHEPLVIEMGAHLLQRFPVGLREQLHHLRHAHRLVVIVPVGEKEGVVDDLHHLVLHGTMTDLLQRGFVLLAQVARVVPHEGAARGFDHLVHVFAGVLREEGILDDDGDLYGYRFVVCQLGEGRGQKAEGKN